MIQGFMQIPARAKTYEAVFFHEDAFVFNKYLIPLMKSTNYARRPVPGVQLALPIAITVFFKQKNYNGVEELSPLYSTCVEL